MPWRLIKFIIIFAILLIFILFNYQNKCDINFGFFKIEEAPVFLTVFISFFIGLLCIFPYIFKNNKKKKNGAPAESKPEDNNRFYDAETDKDSGSGLYGID